MAIQFVGLLYSGGKVLWSGGKKLWEVVRSPEGGVGVSLVILSGGFAIGELMDQAVSSTLSLWPLLMVAGIFMLAREFVKVYFNGKRGN